MPFGERYVESEIIDVGIEKIYSYFITGIKTLFDKNLDQYTFATLDSIHVHTEYLTAYLKINNIPFIAKGYDAENQRELPVREDLGYGEQECHSDFSYGFYNIFPDTNDELLIYFYNATGSLGLIKTFVAYKSTDVLNKLLNGLKEHHIAGRKANQKVIISYDHREIPKEDVCWDDIILPDNLKEDVRISVDSFLKGKHIYDNAKIPFKRGLLFSGPPGNGKTLLCKIIAKASDLPFILFQLREDADDSDVDSSFYIAHELSPAILCIEDLDSLKDTKITLSYLLNKIDGFEPLNGILILATTNKPEEIDPALHNRPSRFDRVFRIGSPDYECRLLMLRKYFSDSVSEDILKSLADDTEGFSMAYLKELYIYSALIAIEKGLESPSELEINSALDTLKNQMVNSDKPLERIGKKRVGFVS